ncbi:hypothetical protein IEQ34_007707 [Dendrobium chrysotoxum]|uniref:Uncharacterized protein n=1 Tax=Dendrobium chrysotoxum TaxID=161865 RepID=A0AAV7GMR9_DENCH|nr:hypothetical protein IEQ34_007707 [Dendrobium chrysotoxum]
MWSCPDDAHSGEEDGFLGGKQITATVQCMLTVTKELVRTFPPPAFIARILRNTDSHHDLHCLNYKKYWSFCFLRASKTKERSSERAPHACNVHSQPSRNERSRAQDLIFYIAPILHILPTLLLQCTGHSILSTSRQIMELSHNFIDCQG